MDSLPDRAPQRHHLRQPLNAISLTIANFRLRIEPKLNEVDAVYVNRKLERIEGELHRLAKMLDALEPYTLIASSAEIDEMALSRSS